MTIFSQSGGFLFISNTKVASSTIHHLLYPVADAVFYRPQLGKHFDYAQARDRLRGWGGPEADTLYRFGVIREPVDWMRSWYKFRSRPDMRATSHARGKVAIPEDLDFEGFIDDVLAGVPEEYASIREQSHVFTDRARNVQMDFLARLDSIGEDCRILAGHPALKPLLELTGYRVNVSDTDRDLSLPAAKKAKLEAFLAADCELYQAVLDGHYRTPPDPDASGPACTLTLDERDRIEDALSRMTLAAGLGRLPEAALWAARVPGNFALDANSRSVMAHIRARGYAFEQPADPPAQTAPPQRPRLRFWRKPADTAG